MIIRMPIHTPKSGEEGESIASMHRSGVAGAGQPGLIEVKTLRDSRSGRLVGMARWEDEQSWRSGVEAMRSAVEDDPFERWEASEPDGLLLGGV